MATIKRITRDNFDAKEVLAMLALAKATPVAELERLLEEACHVIIRQRKLIADVQSAAYGIYDKTRDLI